MGWAGLAMWLLLAPPQGIVSSRPAPTSALAALDAWHRELHEPEAHRVRGVSDLGAYAGENVTTALLATWQIAKSPELRLAVARALAGQCREGTIPMFVEWLDGTDEGLRMAAATGLGRHGDAGVAWLEPRLAALASPRVGPIARPRRTRALLIGLGVAATERAAGLLATIVLDTATMDRALALSQLASAPDTALVRSAREKAVRDADANLAAEALKQLAARNWPGTKEAALGLSRRWDDLFTGHGKVNAVLVDVLARHLDATTYLAFLARAAGCEGDLETLHPQALMAARAHAGFITWLLVRGIHQRDVGLRAAAVRILARSDHESAGKALLALAKADEAEVAAAAIAALAARGDRDAVGPLRDMVRVGPEARRAEALRALHVLLGAAPEWSAELTRQLASPLAELRSTALELLAELPAGDALPQAWKLLDDEVANVRTAAAAYCGRVRSSGSIPLLIERLDDSRGRVREVFVDTLGELTGMHFVDSASWRRWWEEKSAGFALPRPAPAAPEGTAAAAAEPESPAARTSATSPVPTFFEIPVVSESVVFVLDVSGSMAARVHGDTTSRLDEIRRQLALALGAMPATTHFNLIFFSGTVVAHQKRIGPADDQHKKSALAALGAIAAGGGTNVFAALERAYADPEIDTIYLLSDGAPSAGELREPDAIIARVQAWNRTRKVRIHTIAIGMDGGLLRRLATLTGGQHRTVF